MLSRDTMCSVAAHDRARDPCRMLVAHLSPRSRRRDQDQRSEGINRRANRSICRNANSSGVVVGVREDLDQRAYTTSFAGIALFLTRGYWLLRAPRMFV